METAGEMWYSRRDALLEQLSDLLSELQMQDEGSSSSDNLLDHLDGTRRALDRFAAILTEKYSHPNTLDNFSPSVSRPVSVSTTTSTASDSTSKSSLDSYPSCESSPTTVISDDGNHRQTLLDEDDEDVLIRRDLLDINEEAEDDEEGNADTDERFERLSMLLTSVLKEAHAAISIDPELETFPTILEDVDGTEVITSPVIEKTLKTLEPGFEPVILEAEICALPTLMIPKTPYSSLSSRRKPRAPRPSVDALFLPEIPKHFKDAVLKSIPSTPLINNDTSYADLGNSTETLIIPKNIEPLPTPSILEMSLDTIVGDYLNEVMRDMVQSDFIGVRFWAIVGIVTAMWCFQWITQGLACRC